MRVCVCVCWRTGTLILKGRRVCKVTHMGGDSYDLSFCEQWYDNKTLRAVAATMEEGAPATMNHIQERKALDKTRTSRTVNSTSSPAPARNLRQQKRLGVEPQKASSAQGPAAVACLTARRGSTLRRWICSAP